MRRYVLALVATAVALAVGAGSAAASGGPGDNQGTSSGTSVLQGGSSASADGGTNALFIDQGNANEGNVTATGGDGAASSVPCAECGGNAGGGDADASVDQENEVEDVTQNADGGVALNAVNPNVAVVLGGGDGGEIHQGGSSANADGGSNTLVVDQQNENGGDVTATGGDGGGDADATLDQENEVEDVEQNADGGVAINALNPNIAVVTGDGGGDVHQAGSSASADGGANELFVEQGNENEGDMTATGGDGSGSAHSCKSQTKGSCSSSGGGGGGDADASVEQENEVEDVTQNANGGWAINVLNPNIAVVAGGPDGRPGDPCEMRCNGASSGTEIYQGGSSASADGGANELFVEQGNANEGDVTATGGDGSGSARSCKSQTKGSCSSSGGGGGGDADASVEQANEVEDVTQNANGGWAFNVLNPNVTVVVPHGAGPDGCKKDANRCGGGNESGTEIHQGGSSASAGGGTNVLVIHQQNENRGDVTATGGDASGPAHSCKPQKKRSCYAGGGGDADASLEQENEVEDVTQNANGGWAYNVLNPNIALVGPGHRPRPPTSKR